MESKATLSVTALACSALLAGCQSTHQQIAGSNQTNVADKENIQQSVRRDEYKSSGPCRTLLECAVYKKDLGLATRMLEKWDFERTMSALVRKYVYKEEGEHQKLRFVIDAPLRFDLSDEEAASFLNLMTKHRISTNQCGLGYQTPLAAAYLKNYPLSYEVILKQRIQYWRSYDITESYSCKYYPIDITRKTPREWLYRPGAFYFAIEHFDASPQKTQMLTLLLDESNNILPETSGGGRCEHYAGSSALAYSICKGYNQAASFMADYYRNTEKLTYEQKKDVFNKAKAVLANTPSEAELTKREKEKAEKERQEWDRFMAEQNARVIAIREKAERNTLKKKAAGKASAYNQSLSVPSVSDTAIIPAPQNSSGQTSHDLHLYVDEVGVPKETYFKGETCRRYPNSAACQPAAKPLPKPEPVDCWEEATGTARPGASVCPE
ncbi:hypothetical protein L3Q72_16185 [Vibrio sp. JC009]|uniref:hypothetical protein n=1 Tax=Vibrio sp. JC009 TaxID=2912314 RepID=UPI0023B073E9|nr:hypothetical protein [Vibrio sp. JC009]WED24416.1 hypothetical protein L3Q72_16185 [Vibrio sp. JC009]